ncbi:MAG TPA: hypothetical protein V6C82_08065, partial [Chroococcales cyanobacterium]
MRKKLPILACFVLLIAGCSAEKTLFNALATPGTDQPLSALRPNSGTVTTLPLRFDYSVDLTADAEGNIYLAGLDAIRKITPDGQVLTLALAKNEIAFPDLDINTTMSNPHNIAIDRHGDLYVVGLQRIYKLSRDGNVSSIAGPKGEFFSGIAVDSKGSIFASSQWNDTIYKFSSNGAMSIFAGQNRNQERVSGPVGSGYVDGPGSQALFRMPKGLAIDAQDNLYVADSNNSAIRKIDPAGNVSTLVGHGGDVPVPELGPNDSLTSPAIVAYLQKTIQATALAVDKTGQVYAAGRDNRIRKVSSKGEVSVLAGDGTLFPYGSSIDALQSTPSPTPTDHLLDGPGNLA